MHPSYLHKDCVPVGFGKRHLMKQPAGNAILKVLDGGTWSVKFTYSKPKAQFQQGWRAFVQGNNSSDDYGLFINDDYGLFISDLEQSEALVVLKHHFRSLTPCWCKVDVAFCFTTWSHFLVRLRTWQRRFLFAFLGQGRKPSKISIDLSSSSSS